jgi:hypothetical protein
VNDRRRVALTRLASAAGVTVVLAAVPAAVSAHNMSTVYESPLPLSAYLAGAAVTVALSFAFVLATDVRAAPPAPGRIVQVPAPIRLVLRAIGILGWAWILVQGIAGGSSDAAVAPLFLWVYGWVGLAAISALWFPIWEWLDPFATLHDMLAWALRRLGVRGWGASELPAPIRLWPAVAGLVFFVWLELVAPAGVGTLTVVVAGYTLLTLAMMAQFGREQWRAQGETFTVWFRTLNRLAPYGIVPATDTATDADGATDDAWVDPDGVDPGVVVRRSFASGLLGVSWEIPRITLIAIGVGSILFDGLSQTVPFAATFGAPAMVPKTLLLAAFLGIIVGAALLVARTVSPGAIGAGLVPIAVGYLIAHYLTYLLVDGQKIVIAVSDPLQTGADLIGTAFYVPDATWLPPGLIWTLQLAAVVGGHMLGAWAGHVSAQRDMDAIANAKPARDLRHRKIPGSTPRLTRNIRRREIPLAVVMVMLTTLTLWSLGQSIVQETPPNGLLPAVLHLL